MRTWVIDIIDLWSFLLVAYLIFLSVFSNVAIDKNIWNDGSLGCIALRILEFIPFYGLAFANFFDSLTLFKFLNYVVSTFGILLLIISFFRMKEKIIFE